MLANCQTTGNKIGDLSERNPTLWYYTSENRQEDDSCNFLVAETLPTQAITDKFSS